MENVTQFPLTMEYVAKFNNASLSGENVAKFDSVRKKNLGSSSEEEERIAKNRPDIVTVALYKQRMHDKDSQEYALSDESIARPAQGTRLSDSAVDGKMARPQHRHKRRCKRMAVDPSCVPPPVSEEPLLSKKENRGSVSHKSGHYGVRKFSGRFVEKFSPGKRKRSKRETSHELESPDRPIVRPSQLRLTKSESDFVEPKEVTMETDEICDNMEGLNVSSHSSECGSLIYSSDDGRQGDDEFSDWPEAEVSLDKMQIETETSSEGETPTMQSERIRNKHLKERMPAREMRAGMRRLGEQRGPPISIFTSANEKLSRFLQDPGQSELRLHPMQKSERKQLSQLAHLYSLNMRSEGAKGLKCPVLTKTDNTTRGVKIDVVTHPLGSSADVKRLRKTPTPTV